MTGDRLVEVAGHWQPRMEVAGIPSSLSRAIMERAGSWENWCRAFSAAAAEAEAAAREAEAQDRAVTAGEAWARAAVLYHFAQFMFFDDPAQKAAAAEAKVAAYLRAAPRLDPPAVPLSVPFEGGVLKAFLRLPEDHAGPVVILVPGSDSTKEEFANLEAHFLRRGQATVSVDGPGQGEGRAFGPLRGDITGALQAVVAALAARGLTGPLALVGMAFGGNLALRAAAGLPGLRAVVSINGFHDLADMWPDLPQVYRDNMRYALGAADAEAARARAGEFTLKDSPPPGCPVLVIHGGRDRIFPPGQARAQVAWAGRGAELMIYPEGNHVCNNLAYLYRPLTADWIAEALARR